MADSAQGASPSFAHFTVHQHHHFGWTMNSYSAVSPEAAMRQDILRYHPWLPDFGYRLAFKDGRYSVEYAGEPYPPAYFNTPAWARMGSFWFGERIHIGSADDCNKCGGTGVNHYYSWRQCWACGNGEAKGKSSGKRKAAA
jgi:hypothetical protein